MKKYHLYLWIVALVGLMTACSQDEAAGPQTYEPTSVTLSASVDRNIQTRAITMPSGYKLRYILEVWTTGESPVLKLRKEELKEDFSGVDFTFDLTDAGDYNALLWADFIQAQITTPTKQTISGFECDHYKDLNYKTTDNLKNIIRTPAGNIPTLHNDAFCACHPISKKTGAYSGNVQLVRPFGQINIIEKNADALAKVSQTKAVFNVPKGYNVENGMPTSETEEATKTAAFYPLSSSKNDCTANLFYDYIFAPSTGQTTLGEIKLTFISSDETLQIGDFTIPANMPVERNKRTNISGHIVSVSDAPSNSAKLSVTVSDGWSTDLIEKDADVGNYYYEDGTWSTIFNDQKKCIGIVYEVNAGGRSGKIVGLTQINSIDKKPWSTENIVTGATNTTDGRVNMTTIAELITNSGGSKSWDTYPAFKWVTEQNNNTGNWDAANDKWYIPAIDELSAFYTTYNTYGKDNFNAKITTAGGTVFYNTSYYSSSTESSNTQYYHTQFNNGNTGTQDKINNNVVRCIRKF